MVLPFATDLKAADSSIVKVLPQFLDQQGRHALTPSLFDRDAYQSYLRKHPELRSALRFAVQWKGRTSASHPLKLRLELRGVSESAAPVPMDTRISRPHSGWFSHWEYISVPETEYRKLQEVTAWRVTLWDGDLQVGMQKSFLW